jgi:hypothetical protein
MESTMSEDCIHGLPPEACSLCLHPTQLLKPSAPRSAFSFVAKFPGRCGDCGEAIDIGDDIIRGRMGYVHVLCTDEGVAT